MNYRFEIAGRVGNWVEEWFTGMVVKQQNDRTIVEGTVVDHAQLHGMLNKIRDLNLELLSAQKLDSINTSGTGEERG